MLIYFSKAPLRDSSSKKIGLDKNTVYPKYNALLAIAKEQNEKDFRERHELERVQYIISADDLICRTYRVLAYVEQRIKKYADKKVDAPRIPALIIVTSDL